MRVAFAQINPIVGDFEGNTRQITEAFEKAGKLKADLLLTPELGLCGYTAHDLMIRPEMLRRNMEWLEKLKDATRGKKCALAVGHVARNPEASGRSCFNRATVIEDGEEVFHQDKQLLPTYDVFDEARYFEPSQKVRYWEKAGKKVAIAICEDLWAGDPRMGRNLYGHDPVEDYRRDGVDALFSMSASPYEYGKRDVREGLHAKIAGQLHAPMVYVNHMGATDEILFDGGSFVTTPYGKLFGRLPIFKTAFGCVDIGETMNWVEPASADGREEFPPKDIEILSRALITGISEYFRINRFSKAYLGLSGGIDSAVVAVLAARALGPENVTAIAMPSIVTSSASINDAEEEARNLGINFEVRPIKFPFATLKRELSEGQGELAGIAVENLQSRLRGLTLMTLSNHENALVLNTGNKSELATGYCTMYGDLIGAISPLGDVLKTRVYDLAKWMNAKWGGPIPESVIVRPPTAELRPDQKDEDTLPPYEQLDPLLVDYIEEKMAVRDLEKKYGPWVRDVCRRMEQNEHKRRQAPPVLKITSRAFGVGRRIPISKVWDQ